MGLEEVVLLREFAGRSSSSRRLRREAAGPDLWGSTEIQSFLIFQVRKTVNEKINGKPNSVYYFFKDLVYQEKS